MNNKSQFIHLEVYSRIQKSQKSGETKPDIKGVFGEAARKKGFCNHVDKPRQYRKIYGMTIEDMESHIEECFKKKINGKKVRKDANVLLAGVASYPLKVTDKDFSREEFVLWMKMTTRFLEREFSPKLRSVILHTDEEYPHLHFYCYNDLSMNVRDVHPAMAAEDMCSSKSKTDKDRAYKKGLIEFQNRYHEVTERLGFDRNNDFKKVRLTKRQREEFERMKVNIKELRESEEKLSIENEVLRKENEVLRKENTSMKSKIKELSSDLINAFSIAYRKAKNDLLTEFRVNNIKSEDAISFMSKLFNTSKSE